MAVSTHSDFYSQWNYFVWKQYLKMLLVTVKGLESFSVMTVAVHRNLFQRKKINWLSPVNLFLILSWNFILQLILALKTSKIYHFKVLILQTVEHVFNFPIIAWMTAPIMLMMSSGLGTCQIVSVWWQFCLEIPLITSVFIFPSTL